MIVFFNPPKSLFSNLLQFIFFHFVLSLLLPHTSRSAVTILLTVIKYKRKRRNQARQEINKDLRHDINLLYKCFVDIKPSHHPSSFQRIQELLAANPDAVHFTDIYGMTPLHWASQLGYDHIVKVLIAAGAVIDARCQGDTPLHDALWKGHDAVVDTLIEAGASITKENTPEFSFNYYKKLLNKSARNTGAFSSKWHLALKAI